MPIGGRHQTRLVTRSLFDYNYLCHLVVCQRSLVERIGGFRAGFDGSQDYDLLLRLTETTDRIAHIQKILYHWRTVPRSAASRVDAKSYAFERSKKALRDAEVSEVEVDGFPIYTAGDLGRILERSERGVFAFASPAKSYRNRSGSSVGETRVDARQLEALRVLGYIDD